MQSLLHARMLGVRTALTILQSPSEGIKQVFHDGIEVNYADQPFVMENDRKS